MVIVTPPVRAAASVLLVWAIASGVVAGPPLDPSGVESPPAELFAGTARHVVIVTIDGLSAGMVNAENTPNLQRMTDEGAASRTAETVKPCLTLPAHSSLVSGVYPAVHGIYWNSYRPARGTIGLTTIFDVAHREGLTTALIAGKPKLRHLVSPDAVDHVEIDKHRSDLELMEAAIARLRETGDNLMLVHLPHVDRVGHKSGWGSERQARALRRADAAVGQLLTFLDEEGAVEGSTVVIVTADHGGHAHHHQSATAVDTAIPWIVWGATVPHRTVDGVSIRATAATALEALALDTTALGQPRIETAGSDALPSEEVATSPPF